MAVGLDPVTRTDLSAKLERYMGEFTDFADALTKISTTPAILAITANTNVSTAASIPATLLLKSYNGAKLTKSGSGTITFQGFGLVDPKSQIPIFSGFNVGDVTWAGTDYPKEISTELWDTGNTSLTDRVNRADKALEGKKAKLIAFPRTITNSATITEHHWLYFSNGDYPSTLDTYDISHSAEPTFRWAAFMLKNYTTVSGAPGARIFESPVDGNGYMFYAYHTRFNGGETTGSCTNIIVQDLYFVGDPLQDEISGGNGTVLLGNCINSAIRRCTFDRTHAYTAVLGLYGTAGNYAYNSEISDCKFIGIGTQVAVLLNAKSCQIVNNHFDQHNSISTFTYSVLDIEPNTADDIMEDIKIDNNIFDMRDVTDGSKYAGAITVQAALDGSIKNLTISNNKIYGAEIFPEPANFNPLTVGIGLYGVLEGYIFNNEVRGAFQRGYKLEQSRYVRIFGNQGMQNSDVTGDNAALELNAVAQSDVCYNVFNESSNTTRQSTGILEGEIQHTVTTSGSTVSGIVDIGLFFRFFDLYTGLTVTINNANYTVASVAGQFSLTTSTSIGTLAQKTFVDANVNTGTENIAITAHGHNTGSRVWLTTTGTVPTGLTAGRTYFVIRVDADNLKLANTLALALAGTPVNITAASGGGTHKLTPVLITKFSNNRYWGNKADDGITLEPTGTSQIRKLDVKELPLLTGDVTTSEGSTATTITPRVVTYDKLVLGPIPSVLGHATPLVANPVTWTNVVGVSISGLDNKLTKIVGGTWNTAGASSEETATGDCILEFTATEATTSRHVGLSYVDSDQNYPSLDYSFRMDSGGNLFYYELGSGAFLSTYVANTTVCQIIRTGTVVTYKVNGSLVHTSTVSSTGTLRVDTALDENGSTIGGVIFTNTGSGNVEALTDPEVSTITVNDELFIGLDTSLVRTGVSQLTVENGAGAPAKFAANQLTSLIATGTAPLQVTSTTNVPNLNASSLNGATFAAPGPIGSGTPDTLAGTSLNLGGATVTDILTGTASLDFDLTTNVSQDLTITVTGAAVGDSVMLGIPNASITADTVYTAWVSAADTITVRAARLAGTPDPTSGTFRATVVKF